jgi:hypothetical protein
MRAFVTATATMLALALAACGGKAEDPPKPAPVEKTKSLQERDPQAYKDNVGSAMKEVPEASRQDIPRAISCVVSRPDATGRKPVLSAALVREITDKLKNGQTVDDICRIQEGTTP